MRAVMIATISIAACWRAPTPPPLAPPPAALVADAPPPIRLAVLEAPADDRSRRVLRIVDVTPHHIAITRELEAPEFASSVVWVGPDPVVGGMFDGDMVFQALTWHGFSDLPELPWASRPPIDAYGFADARVFASDRGTSLIYARCTSASTGGYEAMPACTGWDYARLWPLPVAALAAEPPADDILLEPTPAPVSPRIHAVASIELDQATCRDGRGPDREIHTSDTSALAHELHWLVAEPPIFLLRSRSGSGFGPGYAVDTIFEGCKPSDRYTAAFVGPRGEVVLAGHALAVFWHGKLVARAEIEGDQVAFAPVSAGQ